MQSRPRIAHTPEDRLGRRWLLELGADPVSIADAASEDLPLLPHGEGVTRAEVADFVRELTGRGRTRGERFDDHGSEQSWPRGSY